LRSLHNILLLILISFTASAQKEADTAEKKADTVKQKKDFIPTGIRLGTDAFALVKSTYDESFKGWELNADVDFYRYYLAVDYGYWGRTYISEDTDYSNDGTYVRIGADVNFLKKDPDKNMFFVGMRYAASRFSEEMVINQIDEYWGPISTTINNDNVNARWFEVTTGVRVKIWKMIWLGYTARLKFALSTDNTTDMLPSDVPGYGRAETDSYWGFNYQIFVRLPVRKPPSTLLKK